MQVAALVLVFCLCGIAMAGKAVSGVQCGVIGDVEFCEKTLCYITFVNNTCGWVNITETPAPDCDTVYYASFVASFGDALFVLYESPLAEANGYATMREALDWAGSVKSITDCTIVNSTAYSDVSKSGGGSSGNDKYTKAILIIVAVSAAIVLLAILILGTIGAILAVAMYIRKQKKEILV